MGGADFGSLDPRVVRANQIFVPLCALCALGALRVSPRGRSGQAVNGLRNGLNGGRADFGSLDPGVVRADRIFVPLCALRALGALRVFRRGRSGRTVNGLGERVERMGGQTSGVSTQELFAPTGFSYRFVLLAFLVPFVSLAVAGADGLSTDWGSGLSGWGADFGSLDPRVVRADRIFVPLCALCALGALRVSRRGRSGQAVNGLEERIERRGGRLRESRPKGCSCRPDFRTALCSLCSWCPSCLPPWPERKSCQRIEGAD